MTDTLDSAQPTHKELARPSLNYDMGTLIGKALEFRAKKEKDEHDKKADGSTYLPTLRGTDAYDPSKRHQIASTVDAYIQKELVKEFWRVGITDDSPYMPGEIAFYIGEIALNLVEYGIIDDENALHADKAEIRLEKTEEGKVHITATQAVAVPKEGARALLQDKADIEQIKSKNFTDLEGIPDEQAKQIRSQQKKMFFVQLLSHLEDSVAKRRAINKRYGGVGSPALISSAIVQNGSYDVSFDKGDQGIPTFDFVIGPEEE